MTVLQVLPLGFPWVTFDPFLFCAHHDDAYPAGNERMGPAASLRGRRIGMDFEGREGWNMYHGDVVPGFPRHPHRGFETVTLARRGYIDHSDSLGATARFGHGDCQWMTAGRGIVHAEMFPLVERDAPNPTELFQVWLNLPRADKLVDPHFTMFWRSDIPTPVFSDAHGRQTEVAIVAGSLGDHRAAKPPPSSWAARADSDVAIWTIRMDAAACWSMPPAQPGSNRTLYVHRGAGLHIAGHHVTTKHAARVQPDEALPLENGDAESEILLLQGRPIGEPVVNYGPFVMTTPGEIEQAILDYRRDGYGGWPWASDGPVHARDKGRFAVHADGREERAR